MKIFNLFSIFAIYFFTLSNLFSQSINTEWVSQIGNSNGIDQGFSIVTDQSGNSYITGSFTNQMDADPGLGILNLTSNDSSDIFITKLDSVGSFIWAKQIGGTGKDEGYSIAIDEASNLYISGIFSDTVDFDPGADTFNLINPVYDQNRAFICKLNSSGEFIWAKNFGNAEDKISHTVHPDNEGHIYVTGHFSTTTIFGNDTINPTGFHECFISKMDTAGEFIWTKNFSGNLLSHGVSIDVDPLGNVYTCGNFKGTIDFDPGPDTLNLTSTGTRDIFITKFNSEGTLVWLRSMAGNALDAANCINVNDEGEVYLTGRFSKELDLNPGPGIQMDTSWHIGNSWRSNAFILKLNTDGDFVWADKLEGNGTHIASMKLDEDDNIYAVGGFYDSIDFDLGPSNNITVTDKGAGFVGKWDSNGEFDWARLFTGTDHILPSSLTLDNMGNIYTTGSFNDTLEVEFSSSNQMLISEGGYDVFIYKMRLSDNIGILEFSPTIDAYPNPVINEIQFDLGEYKEGIQLVVRNVQGQIIFTQEFQETDHITTQLPLSSGIYWAEIIDDKGSKKMVKVVKK